MAGGQVSTQLVDRSVHGLWTGQYIAGGRSARSWWTDQYTAGGQVSTRLVDRSVHGW